ncbi:MAG: single-stranded DNA-binding protein [Anaerolineaceae bacterium]|nr:single-stranded DNA-binding protein [Anaerolineaceae bacterium]
MYHTIILIGNLGKDPETRFSPSGHPVTTLSVATNRKYRDALGQSVNETSWFHVTIWGKQAEACNTNLHKGSKVLVEGRLTPDPQTGGPRIWKTDGRVNAQYEVTASVVRFLSARNEMNGKVEERDEMDAQNTAIDLDDIPF